MWTIIWVERSADTCRRASILTTSAAAVLSRNAVAGTMAVMQPPKSDAVDWSGVRPDQSPIGPLDSRSFSVRLRMLSERARGLNLLRRAFTEQQSHGERFPRHPESASRPSR